MLACDVGFVNRLTQDLAKLARSVTRLFGKLLVTMKVHLLVHLIFIVIAYVLFFVPQL